MTAAKASSILMLAMFTAFRTVSDTFWGYSNRHFSLVFLVSLWGEGDISASVEDGGAVVVYEKPLGVFIECCVFRVDLQSGSGSDGRCWLGVLFPAGWIIVVVEAGA